MEIPPPSSRSQHAPTTTTRVSARVVEQAESASVPTTPPIAGGGVFVVTAIHDGTGAVTADSVDASRHAIVHALASGVLDRVADLIDLNPQSSEEHKDHGEH